MHRSYVKQPTSFLLGKILNANERLAAEHSISQHIIQGLTEALKMKKKRRKRDVRLNLIGEKEERPQFFSFNKVQAARNFQASKEEEKLKKQEDIAGKRAQTVINKVLKEKEKLNWFLLAVEKQRLKNESLQAKTVEKQTQHELQMIVARSRSLIVRLKLPIRK